MKTTKIAAALAAVLASGVFAAAYADDVASVPITTVDPIPGQTITIDTPTGSITIKDGDENIFKDAIFSIDGDDKRFLQNNAQTATVGKVIFEAKSVVDAFKGKDLLGNYVKHFGSVLNINELSLEGGYLLEDVFTINSSGGVVPNLDKILAFSAGNIEFWGNSSSDAESADQTINIGNATLDKYSLLRVHKTDKSDSTNFNSYEASINFDNLTLNDISAVAFNVNTDSEDSNYVHGDVNNITINTLNVNAGGALNDVYTGIDKIADVLKEESGVGFFLGLAVEWLNDTFLSDLNQFGYTALLSGAGNENGTSNTAVYIGTINIDGNTLDLSGSTVSLLANDVKDLKLFELVDAFAGSELSEFIDRYADEADYRLHMGQLGAKMDSYLGQSNGYFNFLNIEINGVNLYGIDGNAVTVNMTKTVDDTVYPYGPEIVLGDVHADVNVNFDASAIDATYQDGENAVFVKGDFYDGHTLGLYYTDGYDGTSEGLTDILNQLATKVTVQTEDKVNYYTKGQEDKDKQKNDAFDGKIDSVSSDYDVTATRLGVYAYGLMDGYETTLTTDADGNQFADTENIRMTQACTAATALHDPSILTAMMWRNEILDMNTRLGEIRDAGAANGLWVRVYGGNYDFDDRDIENDYYGVQVGYDRNVGYGFVVGGALNYTEGDADLRYGDSDNYAFGVSLYLAWLHDSGFYTDVVAKYGRLRNESDMRFTVGQHTYDGSANYNANAYALSVEAGWKFDIYDTGFIEPQIQLAYGYIESTDFNFDSQYSVDNDSIDTLLGRIGVRAGLNYPDNMGSVYLTVSGVKDFLGDVDSDLYFSDGTFEHKRSVSEDMDSAWIEVGLGTTVNITENAYIYANFKVAQGDDVDSWGGNLGLRYAF